MTNRRGRPAEFRNAAEKQKAYRERKKADEKRIELALALLSEVEAKEVTLRNSIERYAEKGKQAEIFLSDWDYAKWEVRGYVSNSINPLVVRHMLRTGALTEVRKDWNGRYYTLNKKTG